jgi:dCTP diphosphatase
VEHTSRRVEASVSILGPVPDIEDLTRLMRTFSEERNWTQFHDAKSLTLALTGEVGEVAELLQWLSADDLERLDQPPLQTRLGEELADVLLYLVRLADVAGIDLAEAAREKLRRNEERFTVGEHLGRAPTKH